MKMKQMKRVHVISGLLVATAFLAGCQQMPRKDQSSALTQPPAVQPAASQAQASAPAAPAQAQTRVDFRLAQQAKAAGLSELKFGDGSLWYNPQPVLTRADLSSVEPRRTADGHPYLRFKFSALGAQKLSQVTQRFPGKLLVLTLDNSLESVYPINQPVVSGQLDIGVKSDQEAVNAVKKIAGQ
ncbi:hypothetical protein CDEF62S_04393 [Castellaniella defragrans]